MNSARPFYRSILLRRVRRQLRRWKVLLRWRQVSFDGAPVLFANSFPKSGTHLLTQVLQGFPLLGLAADSGLPAVVTFDGVTGHAQAEAAILAGLQRFLPGDIGYGHLHTLPSVVDCLSQPGFAAYFILRDPRDVVVSHVHYITEMEPNHIHHTYYTTELRDFDERLSISIQGLPGVEIPFPDIAARFAPFLGWLDIPPVLILRFEDFIQERQASLERVFDHAVRRGFAARLPRHAAIQTLEASINPQRSPTFRSGKVGGWRARFSPQNTRLFKEVAGDLLVRLGYERDLDW